MGKERIPDLDVQMYTVCNVPGTVLVPMYAAVYCTTYYLGACVSVHQNPLHVNQDKQPMILPFDWLKKMKKRYTLLWSKIFFSIR